MGIAKQLAACGALLATITSAIAHEGHGLAGSHWHATDTSGFVMVVLLATIALWVGRGE